MPADNQIMEKSRSAGSDSGSTEEQQAKPSFWHGDVNHPRADVLLLACCFVTGLLDTSTFRNWAIFVSMQTGNTIILCLSTAGLPAGQPYAYGATVISLVAFFIGAFICTRISVILGPKRRIILMANFTLQALLVLISAALATASVLISERDHHNDPHAVLHDPRILIAVGPLAFQSGMTIATSRLLGFGNEIPVTVYTSTYAALAGDPKLFQLRGNTPRNRRVLAVISVFAGSFVATWAEKVSEGILITFWISAGIKLVLAAVVGVMPLERVKKG